MAENIGKIVVSIEAEVAELRKGLASAEAEFKKSADKLAGEQAKLSSRFKKSWTELASKISVVTTVLNIAERTMKGLTAAMKAFGEEGQSGAEKAGGAILAFGDAGIPVISDVINTAEALASIFIDVAGAIREAEEATAALAKINKVVANAEKNIALVASMEKQLEVQKQLAEIAALEVRPEGNEFEIFHIKRAMQRVKIEERLQQQIEQIQSSITEKSSDSERSRNAERVEEAEKLSRETLRFFDNESTQKIQKLGMFLETKASMENDARKEKSRLEEEALKRIEQAKIDAIKREEQAAKKVADKTLDLQTQLNIMLAEQAGDEEKAKTIAIEARYRKMAEEAQSQISKIAEAREAALEKAGNEDESRVRAIESRYEKMTDETESQLEIIKKMKAIELGAMAPAAAAAADGGGGGTATVSTAIGSFTVATGAIETKKQTSLLKRIAKATEKMGDTQPGVSVILAA